MGSEQADHTRAQITQFFGLSEAEIDHQIEVHKYFLNFSVTYELTKEEAFESWSRNIFSPVISAIEENELEIEFPSLGKDELFLRISDHWYFLKKEEDPNTSATKAAWKSGSPPEKPTALKPSRAASAVTSVSAPR